MRRKRQPAWGPVAAWTVLAVFAAGMTVMIITRGGAIHDVVISNARIIDGSGGASFIGGIGIDGDRITEVWHGRPLLKRRARVLEVDAAGQVAAPGFIDTHSHADLSIAEGSSPIRARNFIHQGVTTLIVGNCGRSPFRVREFRAIVEHRGSDVNMAVLCGLNSLRSRLMGQSTAAADGVQIQALVSQVREEMEDGAVGVSTGYAYVPGRFASREEIVAQLRGAAAFGGVHATHMRDEGRDILHSVDEVLDASGLARIPLLISHLKITGPANCGLYESLIGRLHRYGRLRAIFFDQYPYDASSTSLELLLPDWFLHVSEREQANLLLRPAPLEHAIEGYLHSEQFRGLDFASVAAYAPHREWQGLTIPEIDRRAFGHSTSTLSTQINVVIEMLRHGGAQMIYHNICTGVMQAIPRDLQCMVGSDSAIRFNDGTTIPHPRGWGTFPRAFHQYVSAGHVLTVEEMVRRMTDLPARFFGLPNRGRIESGYYGDVVVFDAAQIADRATFNAPFLMPQGISYVFVNGVSVVETRRSLWRHDSAVVATTAAPGRFVSRAPSVQRMADGLLKTTKAAMPYDKVKPQLSFLARLFVADPAHSR